MILAIDPGTEKSAFVFWDGEKIDSSGILPNEEICCELLEIWSEHDLFIEMVASYGMPVGREVFETVLWIGRFDEARAVNTGERSKLVYRREVKMHHCGSMKAKDSNIRQALIDKYGAPGTKKNPGLTYGLSKDLWSAFAIATYVTEAKLSQPQ